jgi:hypothetical protein
LAIGPFVFALTAPENKILVMAIAKIDFFINENSFAFVWSDFTVI